MKNSTTEMELRDDCPSCGAKLIVEAIADQLSVCAKCGAPLPTGYQPPMMSSKAQLTMLLAILSFGFSILTGLPALLLGRSALRDIRKSPKSIRGKPLAVGGIVLATLIMLTNGGCIYWVYRHRIHQYYVEQSSVPIVLAGSPWKWLHPTDGVDPNTGDRDFHTSFFAVDFDDSGWGTGTGGQGRNSGFGYGDQVVVNIGIPPIQNRRTAYFRHVFTTDTAYTALFMKMQRDDGVVIYLDGVEVARDNMPTGPDSFQLTAKEGISGSVESEVVRIDLKRRLAPGRHVLVISLHNSSTSSSDLRIAEISLNGMPVKND